MIDLYHNYIFENINKTYKLSNKNPIKDFYSNYLLEKVTNIENLLIFCNKNNIDIINANYSNQKIYNNFDSKYNCLKKNLKYSLIKSEINNIEDKYDDFIPSNYDAIFFIGMSLDACILDTRYFSFKNIDHHNKFIIEDCCIQYLKKSRNLLTNKLYPDGNIHIIGKDIREIFKSTDEINKYINKIKINFIT